MEWINSCNNTQFWHNFQQFIIILSFHLLPIHNHITRLPDAIIGGRWKEEWGHLKIAALGRQIRASFDGGPVATTLAGGLTFSGQVEIGKRGDNLSFQISGGEGMGHYIDDSVDDAIYDPDIYGGQRTATVTGIVESLGATVGDYSTFFDCCGFGFRHILVQRDFSRSFATQRKIEIMKEEANPDVVITHDTGCVTTLDKSQFAVRAHQRNVGVPVLSDAQFAALAMGAHPYRVVQLHWHATDYTALLEKMGIDWERAWAEFEEDLKRLERGEIEYLSWEDADAK